MPTTRSFLRRLMLCPAFRLPGCPKKNSAIAISPHDASLRWCQTNPPPATVTPLSNAVSSPRIPIVKPLCSFPSRVRVRFLPKIKHAACFLHTLWTTFSPFGVLTSFSFCLPAANMIFCCLLFLSDVAALSKLQLATPWIAPGGAIPSPPFSSFSVCARPPSIDLPFSPSSEGTSFLIVHDRSFTDGHHTVILRSPMLDRKKKALPLGLRP